MDTTPTTRPVLVRTREPQPMLSVRSTVALTELQETQLASLVLLWEFLQSHQLEPTGAPVVRYHTFDAKDTDVEVGIPVAVAVSVTSPILSAGLPGGPAAVVEHHGSHASLGDTYGRLNAWIQDNGRSRAGAAWEVYEWIDPTQRPDPATWPQPTEWRTQIVQPLTA
jgi:effector-binding domain-containing protein